jgi:hypothetical protein
MLIALAVVLASCSSGEPSRDASGQIDEAGDASVFALQVGDCFDDDTSFEDLVTDVPVVPCDEPHDNEVFQELELPDGAFPGRDAVIETSLLRCIDAFQPFVGISYLESDLEIFPITPSSTSWDGGDRVVYCVLYAADLSELIGSMRGAER